MSLATEVTKTEALFSNDTLQRVLKTIIEVGAAQAALYTTVIPNPPSLPASTALATGAGVLALLWNLALSWATKTKNAKLDTLAAAIDRVVDQRLTEQALQRAAAQVPSTAITSVHVNS